MIGNFKAHTDLLTLMKKQSVQEATVSRIEWEKREAAWRLLRHDDAIAKFHNELDSTRFTNPQNRREVRTIGRILLATEVDSIIYSYLPVCFSGAHAYF
jgi:hypothetical protein